MVEEKFTSCRLGGSEINYINKYWDGSFSAYVHNSIKRDIKQIDVNKKDQQLELFKDFSIYIVLIALGAIFFLFGMQGTSYGEIVIYNVSGLFLVVLGIAGGMVVALQSTRRHNRGN